MQKQEESKIEIQVKKEEDLAEILNYYRAVEVPSSQENIVSMLREIQELYGFISSDHCEMAALAAGVKLPVIECIMKLYKSLKQAPYLHCITVCAGGRCDRKNKEILDFLKNELGIKGKISSKGSLSADHKVLLETRDCLKHCKTAPNLLADGELIPCCTEKTIEALFEKWEHSRPLSK